MKKRIMTLMAGMLLLLTACGQTRDNSTSTMLPVAAVQSAAQGVAGVADKTADKAEMPQKEEKTEGSADALLPVERAGAENVDKATEKQPASAETAPPAAPKEQQYPRLRRRINLLPHPHRYLHRSRQRSRRKNLRLRLRPNLRQRLSLPPAETSTPSRRPFKRATSTQERSTA